MSENLNALEKAQVLIEALPYIQRFNRKIIVVKYGGSAMVDEKLKKQVIQDVTLLKLVGFKPIIVHGGGKEISKWVAKAGMEPEFINGLRKTDAPTMEIAEMVLNRVNKSLVSMVQELGVQAVGISGKDGGLLKVEKKLSDGQHISYRRSDDACYGRSGCGAPHGCMGDPHGDRIIFPVWCGGNILLLYELENGSEPVNYFAVCVFYHLSVQKQGGTDACETA